MCALREEMQSARGPGRGLIPHVIPRRRMGDAPCRDARTATTRTGLEGCGVLLLKVEIEVLERLRRNVAGKGNGANRGHHTDTEE